MGASPIREAVGLCPEFTCWNFSNPPKKGKCFSPCAKGFYSSQVCSICTHGGPVYSLYQHILQAASWDSPFQLSADAQGEVVFWEKNFRNAGYPIWSPSPKPEVLTYSDASDSGWGGFTVQVGGQLAVGSWSIDESNKSSTFRELQATGLVLKSLAPLLRGKEVLHRTDNKNTEIILSMGSRKPNLHNEAVNIYRLCTEFNIRLAVEWISRDLNGVADELSWTISLILPVLITWTSVWVLTQSTGLQV